jgi:hypothetical protein
MVNLASLTIQEASSLRWVGAPSCYTAYLIEIAVPVAVESTGDRAELFDHVALTVSINDV